MTNKRLIMSKAGIRNPSWTQKGKNTARQWLLADIDLEIAEGEAIGLVGENSAGKTTLLKLAAGLLLPDAGSVRAANSIISFVEILPHFGERITGHEYLELRLRLMGAKNKQLKRELETALEFSGIKDLAYLPVSKMSSGVQLRLSSSVIAVSNYELIVMDEWISVGDAHYHLALQEELTRQLAGGASLLLASHFKDTILSLTSSAAIVSEGKISAVKPSKEICSEYFIP